MLIKYTTAPVWNWSGERNSMYKPIQYTDTDGTKTPLRPTMATTLIELAAACLGLPTEGHGARQNVLTACLVYVISYTFRKVGIDFIDHNGHDIKFNKQTGEILITRKAPH